MFFKKLRSCFVGTASLFFLLFAGTAAAGWGGINMTQGVTPVSKEVYDLHMLILTVVTVIAIGVFGVLFWSVFHHRKSKGAVAAKFHHNTAAELIWTAIPIIILVIMAVPATKTLIHMEETGDADMTVKVTGYQWKWKYEYLDEGLSFISALAQESRTASESGAKIDPDNSNYLLEVDNPIVLPVKKKIRILTTAGDVIHAWWVPALGWKRDAIPGFINDNWTYIEEPGTYRGQCAELCGKDHGFMPIVLKAVPEEEYRQWVDEMKSRAEEEEVDGKKLYTTNCAACHLPSGEGIPGAFPALVGSAIVTGPKADHINIVLNGKPGTAMAPFGQQLNDKEIAAILTYERTSWGNDAGGVTADEVKAAR